MKRVLVPLSLSPDTLAAPSPLSEVVQLRGSTMGTTWSVKFVDASIARERVQAGIQQELDRVVAQMSTWEADSDLSLFNASLAGTWHRLPADLFTVLDCALTIAGDSGGAYDPTVGPLVDLWGFGPAGAAVKAPDLDAVKAAQARLGWRRIELDRAGRRALQPGGAYVDLSGIAKGYGIDAVARWLRRSGIDSFLVEVGGELRGYGVKPTGEPWWVEVERPMPIAGETRQVPETIVALHGLAVATSGDYRRFFESGGKRYCHTIDPRTGFPVPEVLASVTVLHPECMVADAWATALMVLGPSEGLDWARQRGLSALFVSRDGDGFNETCTPAWSAMME